MVETLQNFFDLNMALVFFIYGQVFFILGLAIVLQSRRHSRLALARSLRWLAAFGLAHGFHEWGLFFIPLQAAYMSFPVLAILQIIRVLLLGVSFAFLFQFGAELLSEQRPWLLSVPSIITGTLFAWFLVSAIEGGTGMGILQQQVSIWMRYLIGFPGALLAAWGLRYQAEQTIKPLNLSHIYRMLRIAGFSLVLYGFLTGVIVPAGEFFPANWLNDSLPVKWLGIPIPVFRSLTGLIMTVTIIRALEVFDLEIEQRVEKLEIEHSLIAERERIGRELHDGAIQQVYTAGLIIESARRKVETESIVAQRLDRAVTVINQAIASLRAYMNELRQEPTVISLKQGLEEQADDPRFTTLMDIHLSVNLPSETNLDPIETTHILAITNEALSNAARHAQARQVKIAAFVENGRLHLTMQDNGRGFPKNSDNSGYGLRNMRDRARLLGGELTIESEIDKGTQITLVMPWEEE